MKGGWGGATYREYSVRWTRKAEVTCSSFSIASSAADGPKDERRLTLIIVLKFIRWAINKINPTTGVLFYELGIGLK